jgi:hypothetical protein
MSAKNYLFFLILVTGALSACKKNKTDNITFHEFSPNVEVNNIDSFAVAFPADGCLPGIPCPGGITATYDLDINSDGNPDFQISVKHSSNPSGYSTLDPCSNYISTMHISNVNSDAQVSRFYMLNESIDENYGWGNNGFSLAGYYTPNFTGIGYIGLRIKNGKHYNYAWLKLMKIPSGMNKHGLILLSYAYNNTTNKRILAGQQQ